MDNGFFMNVALMLSCYTYIVLMILVSRKMYSLFNISQKSSRKFLHIMIGNLPLIMPFFTFYFFPFLVAAPFIAVTFLACSYSPFKGLYKKLKVLVDITEEGHQLGLVLYALSYTFLALFFGSKPYVIASGIFPMAYGDASASLVGEKYGKRKYNIVAVKSLEGSVMMFLTSFLGLTISLGFFSMFYSFSVLDKIFASLGVALVATLAEGLSPLGFDNITVPVFSTLTFLALGGGF